MSEQQQTAQDRTLNQYQQFMRINAASHLIRAAREVGLLEKLRGGQQTLEQLCEALSLGSRPTTLLLDGLVATGIVEQYGDDYALSRVAHLLCQYDDDLGDARWKRLSEHVRGADRRPGDDRKFLDSLAATQWIHTPSAIQAAEILNLGGEGEVEGPSILDLGCGSAVWSAAMAHRDSEATVTAVDDAAVVTAARSTVESIGLGERFTFIEADPMEADLGDSLFDIVLVAQRLSCLGKQDADRFLSKAIAALRTGGKLVLIDLFRGPAKPDLAECTEALKLELETPEGKMRSLQEIQKELSSLGLEQIQFTFLADSGVNMGMAVGIQPGKE